jgi:hypothetical protein
MIDKSKLIPVYLEWLDHAALHGWIEADELEHMHPVMNHTIGWIVNETEDYVVVSTTLNCEPSCSDPLLILKKLIVKRKKVKL